MLEGIDLKKSFGRKVVVQDVNVRIPRGMVVGLLGPNGAGKTTTFRMIAGFLQPDTGTVLLDGKDITTREVHERALLGITYLSQEPSVFRGLSVEDNIIAVLEFHGYSRKDAVKKAWELLEQFGLRGKEKQKAWSLSGGERRRLEVARAIAIEPKYILMDEPFTGIDPIMVAELKTIIQQLAQMNIGVLISDHNVRDTLSICNKAYIIANGMIIAKGTCDELVNHPDVRRYYLGEDFEM